MPNSLGPEGSPTTALFTVDVESDSAELCRLRARGELDGAAVTTLTGALRLPARRCQRFVSLDMAGVTFCDAAGLTALLCAHQDIAAGGGRLVPCDVPPRVRRIMHIGGLDALLCDGLQPGGLTAEDFAAWLCNRGVSLADVTVYYLSIGGVCSSFELEAFVNNALDLPDAQRAMLGHALWELDEFHGTI